MPEYRELWKLENEMPLLGLSARHIMYDIDWHICHSQLTNNKDNTACVQVVASSVVFGGGGEVDKGRNAFGCVDCVDCVDVWMCGCVDVWMCGCVDVWMCGCVDVWMCGCVDVWMCECVNV